MTSRRIHGTKIEKVMTRYRDSLHKYKLPERVHCMNDSGELQETESNYSGQFSRVPSQTAVIASPRSMLSRDRIVPFDTWNSSETQGNFFLVFHVLPRNSSLYESKCHRCDSSAGEYRATSREK